MTGKVNILNKS